MLNSIYKIILKGLRAHCSTGRRALNKAHFFVSPHDELLPVGERLTLNFVRHGAVFELTLRTKRAREAEARGRGETEKQRQMWGSVPASWRGDFGAPRGADQHNGHACALDRCICTCERARHRMRWWYSRGFHFGAREERLAAFTQQEYDLTALLVERRGRTPSRKFPLAPGVVPEVGRTSGPGGPGGSG